MMLGSYPCCDEPLMIELPEHTPAFQKEECPHCGEIVWHYLSRVNPESMNEEAFNARFKVDEINISIEEK